MSDFFLHTVWSPERTQRAYEELDNTRRGLVASRRLVPPLRRGVTSSYRDNRETTETQILGTNGLQ